MTKAVENTTENRQELMDVVMAESNKYDEVEWCVGNIDISLTDVQDCIEDTFTDDEIKSLAGKNFREILNFVVERIDFVTPGPIK